MTTVAAVAPEVLSPSQPVSACRDDPHMHPPLTDTLNFDRWLPYRLFRISTRIGEILSDYYVPRFGLSQAAWRTLAVVSDQPGMSARQIVRATGLDQFTISRAIAQLTDMEMVLREPAPHDKRSIAVSLTAKGAAVYQDIAALAVRIEREMLASLNEVQRGQVEGILDQLDDVSAGLVARGWRTLVDDSTKAGGSRDTQEEPR